MNTNKAILNLKFWWVASLLFLSTCIERIDFDVPEAQNQMVVEGMISDTPGPYVVKISRGLNLNEDSLSKTPVENARVKLFDDMGNVEDFIESSPGIYTTGGLIQGQIGHVYFIRFETSYSNSSTEKPAFWE